MVSSISADNMTVLQPAAVPTASPVARPQVDSPPLQPLLAQEAEEERALLLKKIKWCVTEVRAETMKFDEAAQETGIGLEKFMSLFCELAATPEESKLEAAIRTVAAGILGLQARPQEPPKGAVDVAPPAPPAAAAALSPARPATPEVIEEAEKAAKKPRKPHKSTPRISQETIDKIKALEKRVVAGELTRTEARRESGVSYETFEKYGDSLLQAKGTKKKKHEELQKKLRELLPQICSGALLMQDAAKQCSMCVTTFRLRLKELPEADEMLKKMARGGVPKTNDTIDKVGEYARKVLAGKLTRLEAAAELKIALGTFEKYASAVFRQAKGQPGVEKEHKVAAAAAAGEVHEEAAAPREIKGRVRLHADRDKDEIAKIIEYAKKVKAREISLAAAVAACNTTMYAFRKHSKGVGGEASAGSDSSERSEKVVAKPESGKKAATHRPVITAEQIAEIVRLAKEFKAKKMTFAKARELSGVSQATFTKHARAAGVLEPKGANVRVSQEKIDKIQKLSQKVATGAMKRQDAIAASGVGEKSYAKYSKTEAAKSRPDETESEDSISEGDE